MYPREAQLRHVSAERGVRRLSRRPHRRTAASQTQEGDTAAFMRHARIAARARRVAGEAAAIGHLGRVVVFAAIRRREGRREGCRCAVEQAHGVGRH